MRDHGIMRRVRIFGDVEILLHDAPRVGKKDPMSANASAILVCLNDVVRGYRDEPAVADLEVAIELEKAFRLTAVLWTITAPAQHQDHRVLTLQFGEHSPLGHVVGE